MKLYLSIIFIIININIINAQKIQRLDSLPEFTFWDDCGNIYKLGYTYQQVHNFELGYGYGMVLNGDLVPKLLVSPYLAINYIPQTNTAILGQKMGIEFDAYFISSKVSVSSYSQHSNTQFIFTPEIGLSLFTMLNVTYGYNFSISNYYFNQISSNQISIGINLSKRMSFYGR